MFLDDVPVNYATILLAAFAYFLLGALWYSPFFFDHLWIKHHENEQLSMMQQTDLYRVGSYIAEFILALIIAYILNVFIHLSMAEDIAEGITVALWIWLGFIATTHFSAVLWARKSLKSFFIHAVFMLLGLIAMATVMMFFET